MLPQTLLMSTSHFTCSVAACKYFCLAGRYAAFVKNGILFRNGNNTGFQGDQEKVGRKQSVREKS